MRDDGGIFWNLIFLRISRILWVTIPKKYTTISEWLQGLTYVWFTYQIKKPNIWLVLLPLYAPAISYSMHQLSNKKRPRFVRSLWWKKHGKRKIQHPKTFNIFESWYFIFQKKTHFNVHFSIFFQILFRLSSCGRVFGISGCRSGFLRFTSGDMFYWAWWRQIDGKIYDTSKFIWHLR